MCKVSIRSIRILTVIKCPIYRLIISSNPNNEQALAGIKLIKERYQTWAKLDIKDGNSKRAIYFLQRAIEISPDDEALNLLSALE